MKDKVSYIIVTWNNADIIKKCIDSLFEHSNVENEVIIVDNASTDDTCDVIKDNYKNVRLIETGENLGFSKANNIGLEHASSKYVFFINPDVIFVEDIITPMLEVLKNDDNVGIVSPRLVYEDRSYQTSICNWPSAKKLLWTDCFLYKCMPKDRIKHVAQAKYVGTDNFFVDWTYGAAHLCRYKDVVKIGGYPAGYFMYGEDTEFCMMFLDKLGKKNYYMGQCELIHLGGYSEKQVLNSKKVEYGTNAAMYFVNKYYGRWALFRYRILLLMISIVRYIYFWIKCNFNSSQNNINKKMRWKTSVKATLSYDGRIN